MITAGILVVKQMTDVRGIIPYNAYSSPKVHLRFSFLDCCNQGVEEGLHKKQL